MAETAAAVNQEVETPTGPQPPAPKADEAKVPVSKGTITGDKEADKVAAATIRKLKVKIDGQEAEVDEDEVVRGYQISSAARKRLEEVATLRKQVEGFIGEFKKDPVATLRKLASDQEGGPAFREAVEKFLYDEYQAEKLSPEQKKLREYEAKLKAAEEEKKAIAEKQREAREAAQREHWATEYDRLITEALNDPGVGLPKTPRVVARMAELMQKSLQFGIDIHPRDVAKVVRKEYQEAQREVFGKLSGKALIDLLGEDVAKRIRSYEVEQLKAKSAGGAQSESSPEVAVVQDQAKVRARMTERDFDARLKAFRQSKE